MRTRRKHGARGFTLLEVLAALGLCALLAAGVAGATAFAVRAQRLAENSSVASLLLNQIYAAQRLQPDEECLLPHGWRMEATKDIVQPLEGLYQEWITVRLVPPEREIAPVTIRALGVGP